MKKQNTGNNWLVGLTIGGSIFGAIIAIVVLLSIDDRPHYPYTNVDKTHEAPIDTLNIEKFSYEFYSAHKNLADNSITRDEAAKDFQNEFKAAVNRDSLLNGIPMQFLTLKKREGGKYVAHFWTAHGAFSRNLITPFNQISFDYAVSIPKEIAKTLVEKEYYILDVSYVSHIEKISAFQHMIGYDNWVLTDDFMLKPNDRKYDGTYDYDIDLGMMLVDFKAIHKYSK